MKDLERFAEVPHTECLIKNGTVNIPSIFMFQKGAEEIFPFLYAAKTMKCTVCFDNEGIVIAPEDNSIENTIRTTLYVSMIEYPKLCEDYLNYLLMVYKGDNVWPKRE